MAETTGPSVEQSHWIVDPRRQMLAQAPEYRTAVRLVKTHRRSFFKNPGTPLMDFFRRLKRG